MEVFIAQVINGISLGSIYVLLVTGFNLLLLVAMIIHFAYPQVVVFSMYIIWLVLGYTGNNLFLGALAGDRFLHSAESDLGPALSESHGKAGRGGHQQHYGDVHGNRDDHHRRAFARFQQGASDRISRIRFQAVMRSCRSA